MKRQQTAPVDAKLGLSSLSSPNLNALTVIGLAFACSLVSAEANGLYGNGTGARAMALGGADVAWASDPLGAMAANPAGLGFLNAPELNLGGVGGVVQGRFDKAGSGGNLSDNVNGLPEGAFGTPLGKWPVAVGISCDPESMLLADWHYPDPPGPGVAAVSYGNQEDKSEILVLRTALGVAVQVCPKFSIGASAGLLYNQNELKTPYIFQNLQPASAATAANGGKTLLDLRTDGWGWDFQAGLLFKATTNLQFGISYQGAATVDSTGDATGDPYKQFGTPPGTLAFHYDAAVKNRFPQSVSAGASWKFLPKWRLVPQVDWIDWADAFKTLPVNLSNGSNQNVNTALGTANFQDNIPLNWQSEFVGRAGLEYALNDNWTLRCGYSYGHSPVPDSTLNPMTAAIMENTVTVGAGYEIGRYDFELAYQYDLPAKQTVGTSDLRSGEYSNSSVEVSAHLLALTMSMKF